MRPRRCSRFLFFNTVVGGLCLGGLFLIDVSPPCRSSSRWLRTLRHISAEIHHSPLATLVRGFNVCDDMFTAEGMIVDQTLAFPQSPQNTPPESISPPQ